MASTRTKAQLWTIGGFGAVLVAAVAIGYFIIRPGDALPVYHTSQIDPRLVDPQGTPEWNISTWDYK